MGLTESSTCFDSDLRQVEISGIVLPVGMPGPVTSHYEEQVFVASRALTQALLPGDDLTGFVGLAEATENVRRFWQGENARYTVVGTQAVRGCLYVAGKVVSEGETFHQEIVGEGPLTVVETIDNPETHAATIDGTWTMTASENSPSGLVNGSGSITWAGDPRMPLAYHGTVTYRAVHHDHRAASTT